MTGPVFLALFVFSSVFALASFVFGGHDADHDVSHDVGHDVGDHGDGMPSIFSSRVISLFLVGFSGTGLLCTYVWKWRPGYASLAGIGAGVVMGGLAYALIAVFFREQASSAASAEEYAGHEARVSGAIPEGGTGEISLVIRGQLKTLLAVTADGKPIRDGAIVKIVNLSGGRAVVK